MNQKFFILLVSCFIGGVVGYYMGEKRAYDRFDYFVSENSSYCQPNMTFMWKIWDVRH